MEFLACHSNSTTSGYDAWKPGAILPNIKYRTGEQWGPNQMCEFVPFSAQRKHAEVEQCMSHTAENVKAADQLCRESKSNQQVEIDRSLCYLDYKQIDQCNPEVCNGAPRPKVDVYSSEEYQFRGGRGVDYVDVIGDMMAYTASGQYIVKRAPTDQYVAPPIAKADNAGTGANADAAEENADEFEVPKITKATGPRVDRFSRQTLLMIQKPENTVILDATQSFDLAVPVEEEVGFKHVPLVMMCFNTQGSAADCRSGLNALKNNDAAPLLANDDLNGISTSKLFSLFTAELKETEDRLNIAKLQTEMKRRGLTTVDLTWIQLIVALSTTRELPINPNWQIKWEIDGFDGVQEIPQGIASLTSSGRYFNEPLNFPQTDKDKRISDMPDMTWELTDAEIDEHLGNLWLANLGRARYVDMLEEDGKTKLTQKQYGYKLAKKLLRKVHFGCLDRGKPSPDPKELEQVGNLWTARVGKRKIGTYTTKAEARLQFDRGVLQFGTDKCLKHVKLGLWNIMLSIKDADGTDGDKKIPFTVANCEAPAVEIEWTGQFDDKPGRTNLPLVNPSDKVTISGNVWYFGMGDAPKQQRHRRKHCGEITKML